MSVMKRIAAVGVVALGLSVGLVGTALAAAEKTPKPIQVSEKMTVNSTVEAINKTDRTVTLKGPKGNLMTLKVDESVARFDALQVGDKISASYYTSIALEIRKPGQPAEKSSEAAIGALPGAKPGVAAVTRTTKTVTIEAIDMTIPAVTIKTDDGKSVSFRVHNKKHLEGVNVGDQVVIVETDALMIDVKGQDY